MWSLGCLCFELLTGDFLFDPREGGEYDRNEDHLALIQELLGRIPKKIALDGRHSKIFFDRKGSLKHVKELKFWPLQSILHEKYHFSIRDAAEISNFILPLLRYNTKERATAYECLQHDWLRNIWVEGWHYWLDWTDCLMRWFGPLIGWTVQSYIYIHNYWTRKSN